MASATTRSSYIRCIIRLPQLAAALSYQNTVGATAIAARAKALADNPTIIQLIQAEK